MPEDKKCPRCGLETCQCRKAGETQVCSTCAREFPADPQNSRCPRCRKEGKVLLKG